MRNCGQVGRDPRAIQAYYGAYCAMQQTLARRGPDQRGMYISGRAALIHARLAVVDLENGLQPMQLDWKGETYVLVYNGELYNTSELRGRAGQTAAIASPAIRTRKFCSTLLPNGARIAWNGATVFLPSQSGG